MAFRDEMFKVYGNEETTRTTWDTPWTAQKEAEHQYDKEEKLKGSDRARNQAADAKMRMNAQNRLQQQ